ncbi:chemotaxis protein CheW [Celeribacter persicus]|uniref:Purine-binding chemotaxis protein CheW n=1 Tax=Celeribacter persicus TaxID=1651082 RepID=A0A2T5HK76_9RHOB|nr:chemotaxis protein CheW [Celeribacter persicus]PTQ71981.1 purine-binding chemotaxis protein CheW [Celeribacter persicus]
MTDTDKPTSSSSIELLSFRVGGQDYSVDIMSVREIRGSAKATSLPHAPSFVKGVINLRGTVLPIIDLAARLGLQTGDKPERNVIIVVDLGARTAGLMVDAVSDILAIPSGEIQPPPDLATDNARTFVSALTIVDGRMIRILDLEAVMPPQSEEVA